MSDFPQFRNLPTDVQYNIWFALRQAPRVHFLDLFGVLDLRPGVWKRLAEYLQGCEPPLPALPEGADDDSESQQPSGPQSLVKITTPQLYRARRALSGHAEPPLKPQDVDDDGVYEAVEQVRNSELRHIPGVFRDLVGIQSPVSLEINGKRDVVYLSTPLAPPQYYIASDGHGDTWRSLHREIVSYSRRQNNDTNAGIHYGPVEQLQNIHSLIVPFCSDDHQLTCCGCLKLMEHGHMIKTVSRQRNERRATRAAGRPHDAVPGSPNVKCTMCRQVREQLGYPQSDNPPQQLPDERAPAVREALLANRRHGVQREMYALFLQESLDKDGNKLDGLIKMEKEVNYADDVSVCSDDIPQDDEYGWYNNSRQKLMLDLRLFWEAGPDKIDTDFIDLSGREEADGAARDSGADGNSPPSILPPLVPANYHNEVEEELLEELNPFDHVIPRHGTHRDCTIICVHSSMHRVLPEAFRAVETVYLFDFTLTLKPEITQLPSQGRRWYIKPRTQPDDGDDDDNGGDDDDDSDNCDDAGQFRSSPGLDRGVFIEVMDEDLLADNSIWMFEDNTTSNPEHPGNEESDKKPLTALPKIIFVDPSFPDDEGGGNPVPAWVPPDGVPGYDGYVEAKDNDDDPVGPLRSGLLSDAWPMFNPVSVLEYARFLRAWWAREFAKGAAKMGGAPRRVEVRLVAYLALDGDNKVDYERRKEAASWGAWE